jgi:hypothetical protein
MKISESNIKCNLPGCDNRATQYHHCYPQKKKHIEVYGALLIHAEFNKIPACHDCHVGHSKIPKEWIWNEFDFRLNALKAGFHVHNIDGTTSFQMSRRHKEQLEKERGLI